MSQATILDDKKSKGIVKKIGFCVGIATIISVASSFKDASANPLVNGVTAIGIGTMVYTAPHEVSQATQYLNDKGQQLGQWTYEHTHSDPLGQTVYTQQDFPQLHTGERNR